MTKLGLISSIGVGVPREKIFEKNEFSIRERKKLSKQYDYHFQ